MTYLYFLRLIALVAGLGIWAAQPALAQNAVAEAASSVVQKNTAQDVTGAAPKASTSPSGAPDLSGTEKKAAAGPALAVAEPNMPLPRPNPRRTRNPIVDKTLAALEDQSLSSGDKTNLKEAIRLAYRARFSEARKRERAIKNPVARKLAHWYRLRQGDIHDGAEKIEAFRKANPNWPNQTSLRRTAEESLFKTGVPPKRVLGFFETAAPVTGAGVAALASAHLELGNEAEAARLIKEAWRGHRMSKGQQAKILKRFGKMLSDDDHKARIDKLLYADRKALIASARRTAKLLSKAEQKKVEARAAVIRRSRRAGKLLDALSEEAKKEPGILFARIQWRRRNKKEKGAWELLLSVPNEPAALVDLDEWWIERRISCRNALNAGEYEIAYRIASEHGAVSGKYYGEAKFLSGWIALRFLNKPKVANEHFLALRTAARGPKEIARAEYWLGRTASALGEANNADEHFRTAGQITHAYYGQIARRTVNAHSANLQIAKTPKITEETFARLTSRDAAMAIGIVRKAGLARLTRLFYYQLARSLTEADEVGLVAEIARHLDHVQASVRLSKIALNRGLAVVDYAYPIDVFPDYKMLANPVEPALLHALSRQESEFNAKAKESGRGARIDATDAENRARRRTQLQSRLWPIAADGRAFV